jgi:hypothetical protein
MALGTEFEEGQRDLRTPVILPFGDILNDALVLGATIFIFGNLAEYSESPPNAWSPCSP